ncbi:MAG: YceD family protein [Burkholderiales bacterium]
MSEQVVIDPLEFALSGASLDGAIDLAKLDRLHDLLRENEGAICYSLRGAINSEGKPTLELDLAGSLTLECQRCLSDLSFVLRLHEELIVAQSEREMERITAEDHGRECILARNKLSVPELVEDEILLGLPMSAKHPDCAYPGRV